MSKFRIVLADNVLFNVGFIDYADTEEEAIVLRDAYAADYPIEEGYEVGIEEVEDGEAT